MEKKQVFHVAMTVLKVVGAAGLIATALVAPGVTQVLPLFIDQRRRKRYYYPSYLTKTVSRLRRNKLIILRQRDGKSYYEITEKGQEVLAQYELQEMALPRPKRWDQKWRILMFDIREGRKATRENIRRALIRLGFERLQDSVWVYPYPCEEVMELLRVAYGVRSEAIYLTTSRFLKDRWLLAAYDLLKYDED